MQEMSRRNQHFTDSVIRRMTRVSLACGAINLAPVSYTHLSFKPPHWVKRSAKKGQNRRFCP